MGKNKNEYWAEQIRLQKESGLSQQKWCEENGIKYHTLKAWKTKLNKQKEKMAPTPHFVEVKANEPDRLTEKIEISIGRISFKVPEESLFVVLKELVKLC
jgi:hypothetical protein